jgi:hypothetical protein
VRRAPLHHQRVQVGIREANRLQRGAPLKTSLGYEPCKRLAQPHVASTATTTTLPSVLSAAMRLSSAGVTLPSPAARRCMGEERGVKEAQETGEGHSGSMELTAQGVSLCSHLARGLQR